MQAQAALMQAPAFASARTVASAPSRQACPARLLPSARSQFLGPAVACKHSISRGRVVGSARTATTCVMDVGEDAFESEVLKSDVPVMVDFWATWCGPCKLIAPIMDWAEQEYAGVLKVVKVEADPNPNLVEKYKVYGLPTLMLFKDGRGLVEKAKEGAMSKPQVVKWLEENGVVAAAKAAS